MPLLKKVRHEESGLEGLTEDNRWIPLTEPSITLMTGFEYYEQVMIYLRQDETRYYQLAEPGRRCQVRDKDGIDIFAAPCAIYSERK